MEGSQGFRVRKGGVPGPEGGVPDGVPVGKNHLEMISIEKYHFRETLRKNDPEWGSVFYWYPKKICEKKK
jgi:hypothetical protein